MIYLSFAFLLSLAFFVFHFLKKQAISLFWMAQASYLCFAFLRKNELEEEFGGHLLDKGFFLIIVGSLLLFFLYQFVCGVLNKYKISLSVEKLDLNVKSNTLLYFVSFVFITSVLFLIMSEATAERLNWAQRRYSNSILEQIFSSSMLILSLSTVLISILFLKKKYYLSSLVIFLFSVFALNISGARVILLLIWGIGYFYALFNVHSWLKKFLLLAVICFGALFSHVLGREIRQIDILPKPKYTGQGDSFDDSSIKIEKIASDLKASDKSGGEGSIVRYYLWFIESTPEKAPYFEGTTIKRLLLFYVPRIGFLKNIKPEDITVSMWEDAVKNDLFGSPDAYRAELLAGRKGSVHALFWGDAYVNFGIKAFLVYPIIFSVFFMIIQLGFSFFSGFLFLQYCSLVWIFYLALVRGSIFTSVSYIVYIFPIFFILNYVVSKSELFIKRYYSYFRSLGNKVS